MDQSGCLPAAFVAIGVMAIALLSPPLAAASVIAFAAFGALRARRAAG